jgi:hypothetical protein
VKIEVHMTPLQRDHAEWALDPMADVPDSDDSESRWYKSEDLPTISGATLIFPHPSLAVDDMLYRLVEQLGDMAEQAHERYPRSAGLLAERIKIAATAVGWHPTLGPGWRETLKEAKAAMIYAGPSEIHDRGLFAGRLLCPGALIDDAGARGVGFNHSCTPNCVIVRGVQGHTPFPVPIRFIERGEELTLDYRHCMSRPSRSLPLDCGPCMCPTCRGATVGTCVDHAGGLSAVDTDGQPSAARR